MASSQGHPVASSQWPLKKKFNKMITYGMELFSVVFINERQVDRLKEWREECEYPYLMKL